MVPKVGRLSMHCRLIAEGIDETALLYKFVVREYSAVIVIDPDLRYVNFVDLIGAPNSCRNLDKVPLY